MAQGVTRRCVAAFCSLAFAVACGSSDDNNAPPYQLTGWAALPDSARHEGPVTGHFIDAKGKIQTPIEDGQPIPGWSGLLHLSGNRFIAMPDNGYGLKNNSADFVLGFYLVEIDFKRVGDETSEPGSIQNIWFLPFNDRFGVLKNGTGVDFPITADYDDYPTRAGPTENTSGVSVDPAIRFGRQLTGFDFDVEAIARAPDGTLWVADEFGPYILHFDAEGTLLDEPVSHLVLRSPQHHHVYEGIAEANLGGSLGFESMAFDSEQRFLYVGAEAPPKVPALRPAPRDERVVEFYQFDPALKDYTGVSFLYRKEGTAKQNRISIGDMVAVGPGRFVLIERDTKAGAAAEMKRLYLIDIGEIDAEGVVRKTLLADLLAIPDPLEIGGLAASDMPGMFSLLLRGIEAVTMTAPDTLVVAADTNYPSDQARLPGKPDDTEVISIRFREPLATWPIPDTE
jgi:hypothetical protein